MVSRYVCTYIYTYIHTYICTYIRMHIHTYVWYTAKQPDTPFFDSVLKHCMSEASQVVVCEMFAYADVRGQVC